MFQLLVIASSIISVIANDGNEIVQKQEDYIAQQNIGIPGPNDIVSTDSRQSAIRSLPNGQDYISQQNIGIPGPNDIVSTDSRQSAIRSSLPSGQDYFSQQNIGIPDDSSRSGMVAMSTIPLTIANSGGMFEIPLAVNSRHNIEYVDSPSTMMQVLPTIMMTSSTAGFTGTTRGSPDYISQQNIGIPGGPAMTSYRSSGGVIQLPVHTRHSIEYVDVPSTGNVQPISIEVPARQLGVNFNFRSSSNIKVSQSHQGSSGSYQESHSVDEPIRLSHTVRRPIIQEIKETIQPFRKVTQEVRPVQEEIRTIIAVRGNKMRGGYDGGMGYNIGSSSKMGGTYFGTGASKGRASKTKPNVWNGAGSSMGIGIPGEARPRKQKPGNSNRRFYDGSYGRGQQKNVKTI